MDVGLVCDDCRTFNAMEARACARCGAALSLEVVPAIAALTDGPIARLDAGPFALEPSFSDTPRERDRATRECEMCGHQVPVGDRFCGGCGAPMQEDTRAGALAQKERPVEIAPAPTAPMARSAELAAAAAPAPASTQPSAPLSSKKTMFFGAMQAARAKLVVIKGDGLDGISFTLAGAEHQAGRFDVPIQFEDDPFLSPVHANFFYKGGKLIVRDEGSLNGIFLRIRGAVPLAFDDRFLIGEQVIEVQEIAPQVGPGPADADGTYFYATPRSPARFRLVQRLRGGDVALAHLPRADTASLGREGNDLDFPDDPFISGRHARVALDGKGLTLTDLGSKNGTFLKITADTALEHGDYVFMGQQLLRVEIV